MTDADGDIIESSQYMPFGAMRDHSGPEVSSYKFTDQEFDAETGLYNYNARLYDPLIGRFISPDSMVQAPYDPQTLNRYSYARNNPLIYTDPSGHIFLIDDILIGAAIGAIIGGGAAAATDGDVGMGILTGAIGGAFFGAAGGLIEGLEITSAVAQVGMHAGAGIASGGINAAITGNDVGLGMLTGGISAGFAEFAGGFIPKFSDKAANFLVQLAGRSLIGGITGGFTAEIYDGSFSQGFAYGAATGAGGYLCNHVLHDILRGIQKAVVEGTKAGVYSVGRTVDEFAHNEQLHQGVKKGAIAALKVTVITTEFIGFKGAGLWAVSNPHTAVPILLNPLSIRWGGQFIDGIFNPNPPNSFFGVVGNRFGRLNEWAFSLP
jgi:RHS repeat-associated protein